MIDNLLPGNYYEDAIDVATEDADDAPAGQDIKIIGNRIYGARLAGVVSQHQCRYTWVLGNTIMGCGYAGAKALSLGKQTGDGVVKASGNLLIDNPRSVRLRDSAEFSNNTIVHRESEQVLLLYANADNMIVNRNIVFTTNNLWIKVGDGLPKIDMIQSDWNWYGTLQKSGVKSAGIFQYKGDHTPTAWQKALGQDAHSMFGLVPGLQIDGELTTDITKWDNAFFA